jgi:hypothetical protein
MSRSRKQHERRLPIHPLHVERIDSDQPVMALWDAHNVGHVPQLEVLEWTIERIVTGWTPTGRLPSHKPAGQRFPSVAVGQPVRQVPPQRHDDHLGRERNPATTEQGVRTSHELW